MSQEKAFDFNQQIAVLTALLEQEQEAGRATHGLQELEQRRKRQVDIRRVWEQLQQPWQYLKQRVDGLPLLPPAEQIAWAQSVRAMASLRLLEVDTNSIECTAQVIRVALSDITGEVVFDQLIALPEGAQVHEEATQHNGLTDADLAGAPSIRDAWPRILAAFSGVFLVSFAQEWDAKVLKAAAAEYMLPVPVLIGEDLQRRVTAYYGKEYYLDLATVARRMGHSLNSCDARARLKAQAAIVAGMAQGITHVQPVGDAVPSTRAAHDHVEPPNGELTDVEDHPF